MGGKIFEDNAHAPQQTTSEMLFVHNCKLLTECCLKIATDS